MPNGYNNVDMAYILPDRGVTDAQKLSFVQQQRQLNQANQERQDLRNQRQQQQNLNTIGDELNFDKYKTGEQAIDQYAQGELQNIYNEALKSHISDDPATLQAWLQNQIQPLAKWHILTQNTYKGIDDQLTAFNKANSNIDANKVRDLVLNQFQNDVLNPDGTRKNTDNIKLSDYNSILQNPDVLSFATNNTAPLSDYYNKMDKQQVHNSDNTDIRGFKNKNKWSAYVTPDTQISYDASGNPYVEAKNETVMGTKDENGNPMKILATDQFNKMMSIPEVRNSVLKLWNDYKTQNKIPIANSAVDQMALRHFLYNYSTQNLPHYISQDESQTEPKAPVINNYLGGKNGEAGINDIYSEVNSKTDEPSRPHHTVPLNELSATAQNVILKLARDTKADNNLSQADIYVGKANDGELWVYDANDNSRIASLGYRDINLPANNSVKQKQVILHNQQQHNQNNNNRIKVDY